MVLTGGPRIKLANGILMPQVGLGTWQSKAGEVEAAVRTAIDAGYRLIDTAGGYGNEGEIGKVLHEYFANGKLKREEIFITTKLWCTSLQPENVELGLRNSLKNLQLDYVDLLLAHMPVAYNSDMTELDHNVKVEDTWKALEDLYARGLVNAIGVSNYSCEQMERLVKVAKVKPHNLQVEAHLYWPQFELHDICKENGISFTSYASLGSPGRVDFVLPNGIKPDWPPAPNPLEDPLVKKLAEKYHKGPGHILLRYLMDRGIAVIPKSVNADRIRQNFELFDFALTKDELDQLNKVKPRQRLFWQEFMIGHAEDPYVKERHPK